MSHECISTASFSPYANEGKFGIGISEVLRKLQIATDSSEEESPYNETLLITVQGTTIQLLSVKFHLTLDGV
jgi:hypothetical protein